MMSDFEDAKRKMTAVVKAKSAAEATVAVVSKQMETLKAKRQKCESECMETFGISVKELPSKIEEWKSEYIEAAQECTDKLSQIESEIEGVDAKLD